VNKNTKILVTGGAGYIGSHCIVKLIGLGYKNIISVDNFCNSSYDVFNKIQDGTGVLINNFNIDLTKAELVKDIFKKHSDIEIIIHFAALKDPFESFEKKDIYLYNNVESLKSLIEHSSQIPLRNFIFSSTCAIYGSPKYIPVDELHDINPQNPYALSKWKCEMILEEFSKNSESSIISLRYFNPIGANLNVDLKESLDDKARNIVPQILRVIKGLQKTLTIYGNNLPTRDGSGIRDFIHIEDLVSAHVEAMECSLNKIGLNNFEVFNIGTGQGVSVKELITEFQNQIGTTIAIDINEARENEVSEIYSNSKKINDNLHWFSKKGLKQMVHDCLKANEVI